MKIKVEEYYDGVSVELENGKRFSWNHNDESFSKIYEDLLTELGYEVEREEVY